MGCTVWGVQKEFSCLVGNGHFDVSGSVSLFAPVQEVHSFVFEKGKVERSGKPEGFLALFYLILD